MLKIQRADGSVLFLDILFSLDFLSEGSNCLRGNLQECPYWSND